MKVLIVGLGNIGAEYDNTRHNIGFNIADELVKQAGAEFTIEKNASVAKFKYAGRVYVVIKPTTYMNLSGKAVSYWMKAESIPIDRVLVLVDDLAIPFGAIRLRGKGSDAGHNGLKDIAAVLGRTDYPRLRFGIGDDYSRGKQIDYVLGRWSKDEMLDIPLRVDVCVKAIKSFASIGMSRTMNEFNTK